MVNIVCNTYKYSENDDKMIGCSVSIYEDTGDLIDEIEIADATRLQELEDALNVIDNTYVKYTNLLDIIANIDESVDINATTLNGLSGSSFLTVNQANNMSFTPKSHASATGNYGTGSTSQYGHVKLHDGLTHSTYVNGEALGSRQGYVLNQKIINVENRVKKNDVKILIGRTYDDTRLEEQSVMLELEYQSGDGVYAVLDCDDSSWSINQRRIYFYINGTSYTRDTDYGGFTNDKTIELPRGTYMLTAMMAGVDGKNPTTSHKIIKVV
jgi:hypothetical protein